MRREQNQERLGHKKTCNVKEGGFFPRHHSADLPPRYLLFVKEPDSFSDRKPVSYA
jgi:hypothetical protein